MLKPFFERKQRVALPALIFRIMLITIIFLSVFPVRAEVPGENGPATEQIIANTPEGFDVPGVTLMERFAQGGITMYFLLALSIVMVSFGAERFCHLRQRYIAPKGLAESAQKTWDPNSIEKVIAVAEKQPSVLASAIVVLAKYSKSSSSEAAELTGDEISRLMRRHLQKAYPLAIVATLSPLLGLLGTVTGMIDAFEVVAIAGSLGDASLLAAGIAKALVTTAFGLVVAIPALGLYHHFRGKTHELTLLVEEETEGLIGSWFRTKQ